MEGGGEGVGVWTTFKSSVASEVSFSYVIRHRTSFIAGIYVKCPIFLPTCFFLPPQAGLQVLSQTMLELETKSNSGSLVGGEAATDR